MICTECNQIQTIEPDGICGFCKLALALSYYSTPTAADRIYTQMPLDTEKQEKQERIDGFSRQDSLT